MALDNNQRRLSPAFWCYMLIEPGMESQVTTQPLIEADMELAT